MNRILELTLKVLRRKVYPLFFKQPQLPKLEYIDDRKAANKIILDFLRADGPCMIARYGSNELSAIVNYLGVKSNHSIAKYISGHCNEWWWMPGVKEQMARCAGFFPSTDENLTRYSQLCLNDSSEIDVLGSWVRNEFYIQNYIKRCVKVRLRYLEPDFSLSDASSEWTQALKGKRVLVVHPFTETIKKQYAKRHLLFKDPEFLPKFELLTIKAIQSIGGVL